MSRSGRKGGAGMALLSKMESTLQKKGINNLAIDELKIWIEVCSRNELAPIHNKARRSWKESRIKAEKRIEKLSNSSA